MKQFISCEIETISIPGETFWMISIPTEVMEDAALLLSGLLYEKVNRVKFSDKSRTAMLCANTSGFYLNLDSEQITVTKIWLDAVLGMLLDVCLNGWSVTAHLDQDFGNVTVTVAVLPPEK